MASRIAIHTLELIDGADRQAFESLMTREVLPAAAETEGSINRGGCSAVESQHLLANQASGGPYLWIIKDSGEMGDGFAGIVARMREDAQDKLAGFVAAHSLAVLDVAGSFAAGPRDQLGRPTGLPQTGRQI